MNRYHIIATVHLCVIRDKKFYYLKERTQDIEIINIVL